MAVQRRAGSHDGPVDTVLLAVLERGLDQHGFDQATHRSTHDPQAAHFNQWAVAHPAWQRDRLLHLERHIGIALDAQSTQRRAVQLGLRQQYCHTRFGIDRFGATQLFGKLRHMARVGRMAYLHGLGQIFVIAYQAHREREALLAHRLRWRMARKRLQGGNVASGFCSAIRGCQHGRST